MMDWKRDSAVDDDDFLEDAPTTKKEGGSVVDLAAFRAAQSSPSVEQTPGDGDRPQQKTFSIRRPGSKLWFRTHADPMFRISNMRLLADPKSKVKYVLDVDYTPPDEVMRSVQVCTLVASIYTDASCFIWDINSHAREWTDSALQIARIAQDHWVKLIPNMLLGSYGTLPEPPYLSRIQPAWSAGITFDEMFASAFGGRVISSDEHSVIRRVQGLETL